LLQRASLMEESVWQKMIHVTCPVFLYQS